MECESRLVVSDSLQHHGLYSPWNSPGQNTGVGSLPLLQGIFPTQETNPGLPHCRQFLYQLSHQGKLKTGSVAARGAGSRERGEQGGAGGAGSRGKRGDAGHRLQPSAPTPLPAARDRPRGGASACRKGQRCGVW